VRASHIGEVYMDVGTLAGYHAALDFLRGLKPYATEQRRAA
jgi:hypothetical protein